MSGSARRAAKSVCRFLANVGRGTVRIRIRARDVMIATEQPERPQRAQHSAGIVVAISPGEGPSVEIALIATARPCLPRITEQSGRR